MTTRRITIRGSVPNKKDRLRPGRAGQKMHYDKGDTAALAAIVHQMRSSYGQWMREVPTGQHPTISFKLLVKNRRGDRDGKVATLLDCLVQAGVLANDNIAHCNGELRILPAVVAKEEGAKIVLEWDGR